MNEYAGVNIRLSRKEFERLTEQARQELRHPRDQARYLLRLALGLAGDITQSPPMENRAGDLSESPSAANV